MGRSGTGLGLTVVWNCIHDHNGFIDIKTDSTGTIFNLYLPLSNELINEEKSVTNLKSLYGRQEMVLVVDDDKIQRQIAGQLLKHLNYQVFRCFSGEKALFWLKNNRADLVMIDMIMEPGISGREFYEIMIEQWPAQKTLIVSGFAESQDVKIIQAAGAGPFLKKPYTITELGNAIQKVLAEEIITLK
jgi:CheY-like chemotaxis protein